MKEKILAGTITSVLGLVFVIMGIFGTPGVSASTITTAQGLEIIKYSFFIGLGLMVLAAILFFSAIASD